MDVGPLDHEFHAGVHPGLTAVLENDRQLGKECRDIVDGHRVLVLARDLRAREADVQTNRHTKFDAFGIHRVIGRVVVVEPRLQAEHPDEAVAVELHQFLDETNRSHTLARVDYM